MRLRRPDPTTGAVTATIRTGAGPEGVAAGFGSAWLVAQDAGSQTLVVVDPATATVTGQSRLSGGLWLVSRH